MKIVEPDTGALAAEGRQRGMIEGVTAKNTSKGLKKFLEVLLESGQRVTFLLPEKVERGTRFHEFVTTVLGECESGEDIDEEELVGTSVVATVKWRAKYGRTYANAVKLEVWEGE